MYQLFIKILFRLLIVMLIGYSSSLYAAAPEEAYKHQSHQQNSFSKNSNAKIDINTANASDFQGLKGIGPKKAAAIVEYREKNGEFHQLDDLQHVHGIGIKLFKRILELNPDRLVVQTEK